MSGSINLTQIKTLLAEHHLLKSIYPSYKTFSSVTYDSRTAKKNSLFFCKGNFKPRYLSDAVKNGATGYVSEHKYQGHSDLTQIIVTDIQKAMALLGACFYGYPQNQLFVIAYTGTKGKTTSAYLTHSVLKRTLHNHLGMTTTIDTFLGDGKHFKSALTTPESLDIYSDMRKAVNNGAKTFIMEVSSQSYLKERVYGLRYDVGFFLNITPDHIGVNEHPSFANYLHCKEQLLVNSKVCVINAQTDCLAHIYQTAKSTTNHKNIFIFARQGSYPQIPVPIDFTFKSLKDSLNKNQIKIMAKSNKAKQLNIAGIYKISMPGNFNESNATASAIASGLDHAKRSDIATGLREVRVPGRMEEYQTKHHGLIYVDYAHDYGSLHALLSFLRRENKHGRLICVLGSTGDKGQNRRSGLGKALSQYANVAYLTTDDPGFESPVKIAKEIASFITNKKVHINYEFNRPKAIKEAVNDSQPHDMVIIAGKGRDPYQKIKGKNIPYPTDSKVVQKIIKGDIQNG